MYNVSWGPTRIINKTRRDLTQKLENLDQIRDLNKRKSSSSSDRPQKVMSSPRPTFQPIPGRNRASNGRQYSNESVSTQHQELIRFFNDSWERVCKELDTGRQNGHDARGTGVFYFKRPAGHPSLENFKPFDLEAYWGAKVYHNSTQAR